MKMRLGYVSNSSSSSFVVLNLDRIPQEKINKIVDYDASCYQYLKKEGVKFSHCGRGFCDAFDGHSIWTNDVGKDFGVLNDGCRWSITIDKENNCMRLFCVVDNFDMGAWLEHLGVYFVVEE